MCSRLEMLRGCSIADLSVMARTGLLLVVGRYTILLVLLPILRQIAMKGIADLVFPAENEEDVFQALRPELEDELQRSKVKLTRGQGFIRLRIEGDDIVSIRAALNTWLRLVKIAFEMANI